MKQLIMSIVILVLVSTHSIGQDTKDTTKKGINLPERVAKENVKDVLRGDSAIAELGLIKKDLTEEKIKNQAKDSIISLKDQQIGSFKEKEKNWEGIISLKDEQLVKERQTSLQLRKDLKSVKRKKTFIEITSSILLAGGIYLFIRR